MITAGLEGAFLEEALLRVSGFLQRQNELKSRVMGAMTYPAILGVVGTGVTIFLVVFIVPMFQGFFDRLERTGTSLPLVTVLLLAVSNVLTQYGAIVAAAVAGSYLAVRRWLQTPHGRTLADCWRLKLPVAGSIYHDLAISRFCRVLGTMLHNGVPLLKALHISSAACDNQLLEKAIASSAENVSSGESLSAPLSASHLIPPTVMAMIRVAEQSNTLETVLLKIADRLDQKVQARLNVFVQMIEPVMLLTIGGIVLFIIVGVLLPVFDLNAAIE
jgi:general secretion pathway protein F/type IV pilus assembly protein PilC